MPSDDLTRLEPRYDQIHQLGLDLQYTKDAWLWKFEGIVRETAADLGVLAEYLHDGRDDDKAPL